ncbi:uncharacterized protein LOC111404668 [Olea europaea var. sylvestris]|uniref:uncharacterized protein LOC111404668 n=1 Tax=Olea europaea var. sylvestris TaxID=158386 RepID=UPI000C1D2DBC|nr:uncharacterized protein LOC111404668 [Olea europaea var. sylvestris]
MAETLSKTQHPNPNIENSIPIGIKLDDTNYALWSQIMEMYISGKDKIDYVNGDSPLPPQTDPNFRKWRTDNAIVKSWLINSMDPALIGNFIRFFHSEGRMGCDCYDGLWHEIDFRRPNPMECATDIQHYNKMVQEDRVYTFLDGHNDHLDSIRNSVLQMKQFLSIEQAYAHVRREALRHAVMAPIDADGTFSAVLATKGIKLGPIIASSNGSKSMALNKTHGTNSGKLKAEGAKCSHCGNIRHTRDNCFKLNKYPDWWHELQEKKKRDMGGTDGRKGKVAVVTAEPQLSLLPKIESPQSAGPTLDIGNFGSALTTTSRDENRGAWLLDSRATDHMTYGVKDFTQNSIPRRTSVTNANEVVSQVTGAGSVTLSPSLHLSHTLLVPLLSHKLISASQVTTELNCAVLIYPTFCFLQDILTKEILGRGTKRGGLYYMDNFSVGCAHHIRSNENEQQIWLWHRRLGHPLFSYLKHLLPSLFSNVVLSDFKCNTCILAKSQCASYSQSMNKRSIPFALIHSDVWGPSPNSIGSKVSWFVIFVDDCTRMTWLYLMKHKNEVLQVFQSFHAMIRTQFSAKLRVIRSDNGGEYDNQRFRTYFEHHGLIHETTCPRTP